MSAAWGSVSLAHATSMLEVADPRPRVAPPPSPPPPPPSGIEVRELAPAERARAFRALYDQHAAFVWRNLRRLGVSERDVEDKVQEVFVVAHRRFGEYVEHGHGPRAWLFQIALRVASEARRHRKRHPVDPDGGAAEERQTVEPMQAALVLRRQALELLDRALASVEMDRRAVLVLHEIEQMTAPEIARTLAIPLNTVYSRLRVARLELSQALGRLRDSEGGAA